jgi:Uma2 family endonuclease
MSASIQPLTIGEFLAWERAQPLRYEFDGIQPVAMTGGTPLHAKLIARIITAASIRIQPPCEVYSSDLKVMTQTRVRYPDVTIACSPQDDEGDEVAPTIIFEVVSPSTALTDRRVKPLEYRAVESLEVLVLVNQDEPELTVSRRTTGWAEGRVVGSSAVLALPEIDIEIPLAEIYGGPAVRDSPQAQPIIK